MHQFKIKIQDNSTYAEEGQKNPLRWKTLFREDTTNFVDQSGWIKCKDFYNDTVAYFKEGSVFSIYSYKNAVKKNDEGVYFLLKYIKDKTSFFKNIEVVNQQLFKDLKCQLGVWDHKDDEMVLCIPNELWETTYRISMITMVVRLCNYGCTYGAWEGLWAPDAPVNKIEHSFTMEAKNNALKNGFLVPEKFQKYWWYCGPEHNSEKVKGQTGGTIHNNGVSNWSMFMKGI
jgi:hypothetical protein